MQFSRSAEERSAGAPLRPVSQNSTAQRRPKYGAPQIRSTFLEAGVPRAERLRPGRPRAVALDPTSRAAEAARPWTEEDDALLAGAPGWHGGSLERRLSSRSFRYGYLVTTSPQSRAPPSTAASPKGVSPPASGVAHSRGVTGGVYKARERIHRGSADPRLLATPPSSRRVSACYPNRDAL